MTLPPLVVAVLDLLGEAFQRSHGTGWWSMWLLRQVLVLGLLLVGAFLLAWLLGTGKLTVGGGLNLWLPVTLEALGGLIGGYLLRSWWAVAAVPAVILIGVALEWLIQYGSLWQGSAAEVVPLAIIVLIGLLTPAAIGALIGVALGKRRASHA